MVSTIDCCINARESDVIVSLEDSVITLQAEEVELQKLIAASIPSGVMVDVGAHHGEMVEPFLASGWKAYAFEPIAMNREQLLRRLGDRANLTVRAEAISSTSGVKNFHLALNSDQSLHEYYHSLEKIGTDPYHHKGEVISIQTRSLDDLVQAGELPSHIDYLKIDTEGHDLEVLRGAAQIDCEVISVEFWCAEHSLGVSPSPPEQMVKLMSDRGFDQFIVLSREENYPPNYLYSSLSGLGDKSWGNIFFFKSTQQQLFLQSIQLCKSLKKNFGSHEESSSMFKLLHQIIEDKELQIIDIGAFQGDFTASFRKHFPQAKSVLFEPTPANYEALKHRFKGCSDIQIIDHALGNQQQVVDFYLMEDSATNSLLPSTQPFIEKTTITTQTLDNCLKQLDAIKAIHLIKVDTQGNDLKVLKGAINTLQKYTPVLLVEMIFAPLYQNQDSYYGIMSFLESLNYDLVGIYNIHYTTQQQLAFCDALFLPHPLYQKLPQSNHFFCYDAEHLIQQNNLLQKACDERLELIHTLNQAAEERLNVIHLLDAEVQRLKAEIKRISVEK